MEKQFGVTIVEDNGLFSIEVDDIETSETVKIYDETFDGFEKADSFIKDIVEKEFNIIDFHQKKVG